MIRYLFLLLFLTTTLLADNVTLGVSEILDAYIISDNATVNRGTVTRVYLDSLNANHNQVGIWVLDLSAISAGSNIDSVQMMIVVGASSHGGDRVEVYELLTDFVETQATYNIPSSGNDWGGGGAFTLASDVNFSLTEQSDGTISGSYYDTVWISSGDGDGLTEIVQNNLDGAGGIVFNVTGARAQWGFWTSEETEAERRPTLYIEYTTAGGISGKVIIIGGG